MRINKILLFSLIFLAANHSFGQKKSKNKNPDEQNIQQRVKQLIGFLEYSLNLMGSDSTELSEKQALAENTLSKIFLSSKSLIEDDLDRRHTITLKSPRAYFQDVDYFFKNVQFNYSIKDIKASELNEKTTLYKVSCIRQMKGVSSENDSVRDLKKRTIEINYDKRSQDLRIASIYSNSLDKAAETNHWFESLDENWKNILKGSAGNASANSGPEVFIPTIHKLDLHSRDIKDISPLSYLDQLEELDLSDNPLNDLSPLLNLFELKVLKLSKTQVKNLDPVIFAGKLKILEVNNTPFEKTDALSSLHDLEEADLSFTAIRNIESIQYLPRLNTLNISNTPITDIKGLSNLPSLIKLDISRTGITELPPLAKIQDLNFSNTGIINLEKLSGSQQLKIIKFNETGVNNLKPLESITGLEKIYAEKTPLTQEQIKSFTSVRPSVLIITAGERLINWWKSISPEWKKIFQEKKGISPSPGVEELTNLEKISELDISGDQSIHDLEPLRNFLNLKTLNASKTAVKNIKGIAMCRSLETLDLSNTQLNDLSPANQLNSLKKLLLNNVPLPKKQILDFIDKHKNCLVVFDSDQLMKWWQNLNPATRSYLENKYLKGKADAESLGAITSIDSLYLSGNFPNLVFLEKFPVLKILYLNKTTSAESLDFPDLSSLEKLSVTEIPLKNIPDLRNYKKLISLEIKNSSLKEIDPGHIPPGLQKLNISGNPIKKINDMQGFTFSELNISNTRIGNINKVLASCRISSVICYNTRLSARQIRKYKEKYPAIRFFYF